MKKIIAILLSIFAFLYITKAQELQNHSFGMPFMQQYLPQDYLLAGKVWQITGTPNGMIYMAADRGLLAFDGIDWQLFAGSSGITRSIVAINDSLIYTGSDLDFGLWKRDVYLKWNYQSLFNIDKDAISNQESFWHAFKKSNNEVVFISNKNIFIYNSIITKIESNNQFHLAFEIKDTIYVIDETKIYKLSNTKLIPIIEIPLDLRKKNLVGAYDDSTGLVLITKNNGLFTIKNNQFVKINSELNDALISGQTFCLSKLNNNLVCFGTVKNGLYIANKNGEILQQINRNKGLLNNTILSIFKSQSNTLWLGLDFGIAALDLNNPIKFVNDLNGTFGSGFTAVVHNNTFYLGTNQGLYTVPWSGLNNKHKQINWQFVPNTDGQVWNIKKINNNIFVCHDKGIFQLNQNQIEPIFTKDGFWTIQKYQNYLLAGTYNGIKVFENNNNKWLLTAQIPDIFGACNQILIDSSNHIWLNLQNYGIVKCILNSKWEILKKNIYLLSDFAGDFVNLIYENQKLQVITKTHTYMYNYIKNKFEKVDNRQNTLLAKLSLSEPLHELGNGYGFLPNFNGFCITPHPQPALNAGRIKNMQVVFKNIVAHGTREHENFADKAKIPFSLNSLKIDFILPNNQYATYQYRMNKDNNWFDLGFKTQLELHHLNPGKHKLWIRARIGDETFSKTNSIQFTILKPWYGNNFAIFLYLIILLAISLIIKKLHQWRLKKQRFAILKEQKAVQALLAAEHQLVLEKMQQTLLEQANQQLQEKLKHKTIELANKAKDVEERNKLIQTIKEKFSEAQTDNTFNKMQLLSIKRLLDQNLDTSDKTFEIQMDELHQEFFKKLRERFPSLSGTDLRLCAYLKIGLNSKEIAELMNIQPSSAFISRSRLRKKLNLLPDEDLNTFLNQI